MKQVLRVAGLLLGVVAAASFVTTAYRQKEALTILNHGIDTILYLIAALSVYVSVLFIAALVWRRLLTAFGERVAFSVVLGIQWKSQFAKYIPGNIAQHMSRLDLANRRGIKPHATIASVAVETAMVILAASITSVSLMWRLPSAFLSTEFGNPSTTQLTALAGVSALVPVTLAVLMRTRFWKAVVNSTGHQEIQMPSAGTLTICLLLNLLGFVLLGAMVWLVGRSVSPEVEADVRTLSGVFAVAWMAGFVTPGAPAGMGIREALLAAGLGPIYGVSNSIAITVGLRVVTLAGDALAWILGAFCFHRTSDGIAPGSNLRPLPK